MKIWDVEQWKREITVEQVRKWLAYYRHDGGFGCQWRMMGRATSWIRAAFTGRYDKDDEVRFQLSYREGDEYKPAFPLTPDEIAERMAQLPGMVRVSNE